MKTSIPIQNLYYIFCYAWDRFHEGQAVEVSATDSPELADLFAKVLINGTKRLLRRGIDRGYLTKTEDTPALRGRILLGESIKRNLLRRVQACCEFDELQHDVLHNQILKTTLQCLAAVRRLDSTLRHELRVLDRHLSQISTIRLEKNHFGRVQLHRNNAFYRFLMRVCELVYDSLLPEEAAGKYRFADILEDEQRMGDVFEAFVRNFYRLEQKHFSVSSEHITWDTGSTIPSQEVPLPVMRTDVSLRSPSRTIIMDAKFYKETLQTHHGKQTVQSGHLYQIFAYLKNLEARDEPDSKADGILVYPTASETVDAQYQIQGHNLRVYTLNLARDWHDIRDDLLKLVANH